MLFANLRRVMLTSGVAIFTLLMTCLLHAEEVVNV